MKIESIQGVSTNFKGKRLDRNAVSQLIKNNPYSLTEPNQRYISTAIKALGKVAGEKNIQFLLDAAAQSRYSTSITLQDAPKNDWRTKLLAAAASALAITPLANSTLADRLSELQKPREISIEEQEILQLRKQLLAVVDLEQINNESLSAAKNFVKNLDYFIVSSETSLEHKKYVLERLNYFMSDKYEINPQLKDKKSLAVAEMVNDMAIHTPGNEIPNIKAVNQKQHGMCAAISIVRKKLAYEDKPNYVDSIISELDDSGMMSVYDRSQLGTGKRILVEKVPVDFDAALAKGYRIIDASTMHWMQVAGMSGSNNVSYSVYNPFDRNNFDVKTDSFFIANFEDEELAVMQRYYQALIKANSVIEDYKADKIKRDITDRDLRLNEAQRLSAASDMSQLIKDELSEIAPELSRKEVQRIASGILSLEKPISSKIQKGDNYSYIPNEEEVVKRSKIRDFIINAAKVEAVDEESIDKIFYLVNEHHSLTAVQERPSRISAATKLYDVAAAFRYQIVAGLEDKRILDNIMHNEGIANKETLLLDTIDKLIAQLENNSSHSDLIMKQLQQSAFDNTNGSKEETIAALKELKEIITYHLTESLDSIYASLTMGGRKEALLAYIENAQNIIKEGHTQILKPLAEQLGVKKSPKNVVRALEADRQKLLTGDETEYSKLFDKYGSVSQIEYISNLFQNFIEQSKQDDNQEVILNFLAVNGISVEDGEQAVVDRINLIGSNIQAIATFFNQAINALRVVDENGDVLFSANPKDVIIKKLENENRMSSAKQLRELQAHLEKIAKDRSSDEFQSRQGRLKDKSLENFSASERNTLKEVESSINPMYSYIQKQMRFVRSDMKEYLEELARMAGVNDGNYWVPEEGSSGLYTGQEIRVLEYMTGRPHYSTKNIQEAIEKVKTSPYSAISSSSVFHDKMGGHAQYVADIEPVTLKSGEVKEVLFNDNSWGASENENIWIDSNGLMRTDYSNRRGGTLGYITNDKFRNGNFVDRILTEMITTSSPDTTNNKIYKRMKHPTRESYSYPQYYGMILDGQSSGVKTVSDRIHDAIFVTNNRYVDKLKKLGETLSEAELRAMITNIKSTGKNWKPLYEALKHRVFPLVGNGIQSREEYERLADDDYLKVVLEKIALKQNGQTAGLEPDIARVRNVRELSRFRAAQKTRALNSFKYAFAKSMTVVDYLADSYGDKEFLEMQAILDKHGIKLSDDELNSIREGFSIDKDIYDGSAKTTINLLIESIREDINNVVSNPEVQQELEDFFRKFLTEKLYFNKEDLDLSDLDNQKIAHIIKFIDRVYDPEDDDEFVEIYRRIQDMTEDEFKAEILSKATYEDMGIKSLTGYDILKKLQRYEESANTTFMNTVYYDSLVTEIDSEKYEPTYKLSKLSRSPRLKSNYTFNTMYRDLNYDLSLLTLPKLFNKYKGKNLEQYGAYPAYPQVDYLSDEHVHTSFDSNVNTVEQKIDTIKTLKEQIQNYEIAHLLQKLKGTAKSNLVITGKNYEYLNNLFGRLITLNLNDPSVKDVTDAAEAVLEFEEGMPWTDYLPYIDVIIDRLTDFENTTSKEVLEQVIESNRNEIAAHKKAFSEVFIQPRYQARVAERYNRLEQALINQDSETAEILKNELLSDFKKYHILNDTEELLSQFIRSCAKDSPLNSYNEIFEKLLIRAIEYAKMAEIQDILMDAINDGVALNAKSRFDKHMLTMSNGEFLMGSDEMVAYMTNSLITDGQYETALMFLEKLGLNEQYVKNAAESFDYEGLEKVLRSAHELATNFANFQKDIDPIINSVQTAFADNNCDYTTLLDNLRKEIAEKAASYSLTDDMIGPLLFGVDTIEYNCDNNPTAQKQIVFATVMTTSKQRMVSALTEEISNKNTILASNATILDFINHIMLPAASEADQLRTEINEHFAKLAELKDYLVDLQGDENSDKI